MRQQIAGFWVELAESGRRRTIGLVMKGDGRIVLRAYREAYPANVTLGRMREVMKHVVSCFEQPEKPRKAIRKAAKLAAYEEALDRLFDDHALRQDAGFVPDG